MFKLLFLLIPYSIFYYFFRGSFSGFTRLISTLNALQCVYMAGRNILNTQMFDLYYITDTSSKNALMWFSTYLFVDGIFLLPMLKLEAQSFLTLLHHFVGGLGIYIIAWQEMGFFLGFYFAMTEVSTPFLNLSWTFRKKKFLMLFYIIFTISRIFSIPILLLYLYFNSSALQTIHPFFTFMSFYGSYTLITLNLVWFFLLTRKITEF